ncbi:molybdopterin-dependent oxidoreductase, partial [Candidatus Bathyarchaeota archaeon]|nr:molybdopterin-dependent oxidoreductase [Candidatus Bathyarchaeota archaeon]
MASTATATCPVCGTLCDDIEVSVKDNAIEGVRNACAIGEAKFLNCQKHRLKTPLIRRNGQLVEATWDEALKRSAEILTAASYPILYGWSSTSCEAVRKGLELAEEVGGVIDNTSTVCHGQSLLSVQDIGIASCTLGQIRHRADLIIYWGCDPWSAHPRHMERYTAFSEGRFRESDWRRYVKKFYARQLDKRVRRASSIGPKSASQGLPAQNPVQTGQPFGGAQGSRKMMVVDARRTRTADAADYFLQVEPNTDYEVMEALRMLIKGEDPDLDEVAGVPIEELEEVADVMAGCKLGVLFFGMGLT